MNTAKNRTEIKGTGGEIILYRTKDGRTTMDVRLDKETVWLNLNQIAALFGRDKSVVSRHLSNIFGTKELNRESTVAFFATVRNEGGHDLYPSIEEKAPPIQRDPDTSGLGRELYRVWKLLAEEK